MKAFFHKLLHSSPLYVAGRVVPFTLIGDDEGVLATENETLIGHIRDAIKRGVGAVREVTEAEFEDAKKKPVSDWLAKLSSPPELVIMAVSQVVKSQPGHSAAQADAATASSPEPKSEPAKPRVQDIAAHRPVARKVAKQ